MADAPTKSTLWQELKEAGWKPPMGKAFVNYTVVELQNELMEINTQQLMALDPEMSAILAEAEAEANRAISLEDVRKLDEPINTEPFSDLGVNLTELPKGAEPQGMPDGWGVPPVPASAPEPAPAPRPVTPPAPRADRQTSREPAPLPAEASWQEREARGWPGVPRRDEADTIAGTRINTHGPNDPVRVDSRGRAWFRDEVQKPSTPQPRARRVLHVREPGTKTIEQRNKFGILEESFEVAGDDVHDLQVKVTLPPWQVGVFKDPSHPFRIHTYGGAYGYDRLDVTQYYGGMLHVPSSCRYVYVGGDLCFQIASVRDTIETEYRERTLRIERPFS